MISNRIRPYIYGWKTIIILCYLKIYHRAHGWKFFFSCFNNFRFDGGHIYLAGNNWIESYSLLHCSGGNISIGERTFVNRNTIITAKKLISIGNDVLIGDNVSIYDHDHNISSTPYGKSGFNSAEIIISDNVWIGSHSTVLKGVHIGENSILAAGSVLTKSIPNDELWGGVPAKQIKKLFFQKNPP